MGRDNPWHQFPQTIWPHNVPYKQDHPLSDKRYADGPADPEHILLIPCRIVADMVYTVGKANLKWSVIRQSLRTPAPATHADFPSRLACLDHGHLVSTRMSMD
jgi:hypothetical protein